jgi:ketosteroid isomerase-like protein
VDAADRVGIDELYARHAWALDTGDADAVAALYVEDAVIDDVLLGRHEGPQAARRFAEAARADPSFPGRQHWGGHREVQEEGDGVRVTSFGLATQLHPAGATYLPWLGWTEDVLVRGDGGWRFARRTSHRWEGEVLEAFPGRRREPGPR